MILSGYVSEWTIVDEVISMGVETTYTSIHTAILTITTILTISTVQVLLTWTIKLYSTTIQTMFSFAIDTLFHPTWNYFI